MKDERNFRKSVVKPQPSPFNIKKRIRFLCSYSGTPIIAKFV